MQSSISLHSARHRDLPRVTLIKNAKIYQDVLVLSGKFPKCKTICYADHDSALVAEISNTGTNII